MPSWLKRVLFSIFAFLIYVWYCGWQGAVLISVCIGWHEHSHIVGAKIMGLRTKGWVLLPVIGGVSFITDRYKTYGQQAFVVLAGPMGGGIQALLCLGLYLLTGYPWSAAGAYIIAFIQAFNLAPSSFMDGGQLLGTITYSINRTLGVVCFTITTVLAAIALLYLAPFLGVVIAVAGYLMVQRELRNWKHWKKDETYLCSPDWIYPPKKLTKQQTALLLVSWIGTIVVMVGMMIWLRHLEPETARLGYFFHH